MTCRWWPHKWGKWTAENTTGVHMETGTKFTVGVQWRECQRCGKRQQEEL